METDLGKTKLENLPRGLVIIENVGHTISSASLPSWRRLGPKSEGEAAARTALMSDNIEI